MLGGPIDRGKVLLLDLMFVEAVSSGENILLKIQRKNTRTSRGWIDDKWLEVKGNKDIKSFISSSLTDVSKCSIKVPDKCEKQMLPSLWHLKTTKWRQLLNTQLRSKILMCLN